MVVNEMADILRTMIGNGIPIISQMEEPGVSIYEFDKRNGA